MLVVDLLLFHVTQMRFVVVELKIGRFFPAYVGQLGTCVAVVDDRVRDHTIHAPTVGLMCTSCDEQVVRYALAWAGAPLPVATYDTLTTEQRRGLPDLDRLTSALKDVLADTSCELTDDEPADT